MNIMINFDEDTGGNRQEHNPDWSQSSDHPYRILTSEDLAQEEQMHLLI